MMEPITLSNELRAPESLTDALQSQVAFYKGEYENLRIETKALVKENAEISRQLDGHLKHRCEQDAINTLQDRGKEIIEDLKQQLLLSQKEKESFASLWNTSQTTIKSLEDELKTYQNYQKTTSFQGDIDEVRREYSALIKMLENKLTSSYDEIKSKEKSIKLLTEENGDIKKQISEKESSLHTNKEKQSVDSIKIASLEKESAYLKNELSMCKRNSEDLMNNMEICRQNMDSYAKKESECRYKVAEALRIVDAAISERDAAIEREKSTAEEGTRLSNQVTNILNESTLRVQKEIDLAKQSYNDKLNDMLIHIQRLELEMGEKNLSLERALRDCKMLEDEIERHRKGTNNQDDENGHRVLLLEQKLEATFQQLILSERRNIQIVSEKESLQMDFDQMTNGFQRDKRRRKWEEKLHTNEVESLRTQIGNLKEALDEAHKTIQRLQAEIIVKEQLEENLSSEKIQATKEFERHFETQQKLNMKWKDSMKDITYKLQNRLEELKIETKRLRRDNAKLRIKCGEDPRHSESDSLRS